MPAFYNLQDQHDELDLFLYQLGKTSGGRRVAPLLDNIWPIIKLLVKWQKVYFIVMMIGTCPLWYTPVTEILFQVMYSLVLNYKNVISLMFVRGDFTTVFGWKAKKI